MLKKLNKVLIVAGGTGGHVFPGLALAKALQEQNVTVEWLGTPTGIETQLVPAAGIPITYINVRGIRGMGWRRWVAAPFLILKAVITALQLLRRYQPDVVCGLGGFAAGPAGVACLLTRTPLVVHEQNAIPGFTNRVLSRWAKHVFLGLPQPKDHPHRLQKGEVIGNPVRSVLFEIPSPAERFTHRQGPLRVLILGGSQGAVALNKLIPEAFAKVDIAKLADQGLEIWHQVGAKHLEAAKIAYNSLINDSVRLVPFIDDMASAYAWADLVICRSGALTVAELAASGVGSLLIPFPAAIDDHQTYNAKYLVDLGAAELLPQATLTAEKLAECIQTLGCDREKLLEMAENARKGAFPDATEKFVKNIETVISKES
jgi:UDP-N-acetylglucosamine--N-acetylmuramyl-(pentapeptide) pyrophosphoryl-undecaprenol N-acetylglucosamine transferase